MARPLAVATRRPIHSVIIGASAARRKRRHDGASDAELWPHRFAPGPARMRVANAKVCRRPPARRKCSTGSRCSIALRMRRAICIACTPPLPVRAICQVRDHGRAAREAVRRCRAGGRHPVRSRAHRAGERRADLCGCRGQHPGQSPLLLAQPGSGSTAHRLRMVRVGS